MRLTIVQPYVPRYRTAFYDGVRQALEPLGIELQIVVGRTDSDRHDGDVVHDAVVRPDLLENLSNGSFRYRRLHGLIGGRGDLLLLEQAIKNLDSYLPLLSQHLNGPSVGFWGHGRSYSSTQPRAFAALKQWMTRRGTWFFAYTESGARDVIDHGFPASRVTVVNNTLDTASLRTDLDTLHDPAVDAWCAEQRIDRGHTALFIGGVDARKDVDYLVASARIAQGLDPKFVLLIAGSGEDLDALREAQRAGAPIRVLGRVDGPDKAMALRSARLLTIPSQLGLVVVDSFAAGTPIVTRHDRLHGPEAEYLTADEDSLWLPRDAVPEQYAHAVVDLLNDSARLTAMADGCREKRDQYTLDAMVERFVTGVRAWAAAEAHP